MSFKVEFFEPPMCCSTGICGPSVDEKLVRLSENIEILKNKYKDIMIERYMITTHPLKFRENSSVFNLVKEKGRGILPITTVNGEVIKTGDYPSLKEIEKKIAGE